MGELKSKLPELELGFIQNLYDYQPGNEIQMTSYDPFKGYSDYRSPNVWTVNPKLIDDQSEALNPLLEALESDRSMKNLLKVHQFMCHNDLYDSIEPHHCDLVRE